MSRFSERRGTALLVVDMQKDVLASGHDRDAVIETIARLVERARSGGTPVVWVQHSDDGMPIDSDGWQFVSDLVPANGEPVVRKEFGDAFEATALSDVLEGLGVGRVVVTGAQTDACIRSTLHGALGRGFDTVLVADGHTTEDLRRWGAPIGPAEAIAYTNLYWEFSRVADARGAVALAADVNFT